MTSRSAEQANWFTEAVRTHEKSLRSYLRGAFPNVRDVDDVVQESFLRIWNVRNHQSIRSARGFLFTVARRLALNVIRKDRNAPFVADQDQVVASTQSNEPDAAAALLAQERINLLADALTSLPPRCREVILLHKIQGLSQREVAVRLKLSERTVESHVRNGIARCHAFLRSRGLERSPSDAS